MSHRAIQVNVTTQLLQYLLHRKEHRQISMTRSVSEALALLQFLEREIEGGGHVVLHRRNGSEQRLELNP